MQKICITAQFHSYWHVGTGRGSGQHLDALVEKDEAGLPYVSGKTLKGLLRDAAYKLDSWQQTNLVSSLFGSRTDAGEDTKNETESGLLRFSNLELEEKAFLSAESQKHLVSNLYQTINSTAIDEQFGSAKHGTLRSMEVVIPVKLYGDVHLLDKVANESSEQQAFEFQEVLAFLEKIGSMVTHIGANKNRGFGRVTLEINGLNQ